MNYDEFSSLQKQYPSRSTVGPESAAGNKSIGRFIQMSSYAKRQRLRPSYNGRQTM